MLIEFEHGLIRPWRTTDKADLLAFANSRRVWQNLADRFPHPYTEADADFWLMTNAGNPGTTNWTLEIDGRAAGGMGYELYLRSMCEVAEFGYWLGEPFWGRGIMSAAVNALIPELVRQFGLVRLEAHVFPWNNASMRVLEKAGFQREGRLHCSAMKAGRRVDEILYGYVDEHAADCGDPGEPPERELD